MQTETTPATLPNDVAYELALLEARIIKARRAGLLDIASAWDGIAEAPRSGQLTLSRYLTSARWQALFGGRAVA
jgi:hypothetical protein